MKPMRIVVLAVAACVLLWALGPPALALSPFEEDHWEILSQLGVARGWEGSMQAESPLSRGELVTLAVRSLDMDLAGRLAWGTRFYPHVDPHHWASGYLTVAGNLGLLDLLDELAPVEFCPDEDARAADLALTLMFLLGWEEKIGDQEPAAVLEAARERIGCVFEDADLSHEVSRDEAARVLARTLTSVPTRDGSHLADALYTWDQPRAVQVRAEKERLVAGGHQASIWARVVDESGRPVRDWEGTLELELNPWILEVPGGEKAWLEGGQTSFALESGLLPGEVEVKVRDAERELKPGKLDLLVVKQKPTSLELVPDLAQISADGHTRLGFTASILDQEGLVIPASEPEIRFELEGPAVWAEEGGQEPRKVPASGGEARIEVIPHLNEPGRVRVTAAAKGLDSSEAEAVTVIPRPPARVELRTAEEEPSVTADGPVRLEVRLLDEEGHLITHPAFQVGGESGPEEITLDYSGQGEILGPRAVTSTERGVAEIHVRQEKEGPISVRAGGENLISSEVGLVFSPGEVFTARFAQPDPLESDPSVPYLLKPDANSVDLSLELADRAGNPVAREGYEVEWWVASGLGVLSGDWSVTGPGGKAQVSVTVGWPQEEPVRVGARITDPRGELLDTVFSPSYRVIEGPVPEGIRAELYIDQPGDLEGRLRAGEEFTVRAQALDRRGDPVPGVHVKFCLGDGGTARPAESHQDLLALTDGEGRAEVRLVAQKAGPAPVRSRLVSVPGGPEAWVSAVVESGKAVSLALTGLPGQMEEEEVYQLGVELRDGGGNPVLAGRDLEARVSLVEDWDRGLSLRETLAGVSRSSLKLTIPEGRVQAQFYVVVNEADGPAALTLDSPRDPSLAPEPVVLMGPGLSGAVNLSRGHRSLSITDVAGRSEPGDRVAVYPGVFTETVLIDTPDLEISAVDPGTVQVDGQIHVQAPGVRLEGLAVRPMGFPEAGVNLWASDVTLRNMEVDGAFTEAGVRAGSAQDRVSGLVVEETDISSLSLGFEGAGIQAYLGPGSPSRISGCGITVHEGMAEVVGIAARGQGAEYVLEGNSVELVSAAASRVGLDLAAGPGGQGYVHGNQIQGETVKARWPEDDSSRIESDLAGEEVDTY